MRNVWTCGERYITWLPINETVICKDGTDACKLIRCACSSYDNKWRRSKKLSHYDFLYFLKSITFKMVYLLWPMISPHISLTSCPHNQPESAIILSPTVSTFRTFLPCLSCTGHSSTFPSCVIICVWYIHHTVSSFQLFGGNLNVLPMLFTILSYYYNFMYLVCSERILKIFLLQVNLIKSYDIFVLPLRLCPAWRIN